MHGFLLSSSRCCGSIALAAAIVGSAAAAWADDQPKSPRWTGFYGQASVGNGNSLQKDLVWTDAKALLGGEGQYFTDANSGYGSETAYKAATSQVYGLAGGVALGYQRQFNWFLLGGELGGLGLSDFANGPKNQEVKFDIVRAPQDGKLPTLTTYTASSGYDERDHALIGLARLRTGAVIGSSLVYLSSGAAYNFVSPSTRSFVAGSDGTRIDYSGKTESNAVGWTVGAGFEYAFTANLSAGVEYMRIDFGNTTFVDPLASYLSSKVVTQTVDRQLDVVRGTVSWKFDWPVN